MRRTQWLAAAVCAVLMIIASAGLSFRGDDDVAVAARGTVHPTGGGGTSFASPTRSATPAPITPAGPTATTVNAPQLPRGGRQILGHSRVVAFYGAAGGGQLGVLGAGSPESAANKIIAQAARFDGFGEPVQPAMELIATVAQAGPGPGHTYSSYVGDAVVRRYLAVAHEHRMLLILDLQPGRATFLSQAKRLRPFLTDPSVELALDPEWKVGPGQSPGDGGIGSSSAAGINEVGSWLSALVAVAHLPDKLLVVHQFTFSMLPDRRHITQHPGIEMVLHADGFGSVREKLAVLHQLAFPHPPFGVGFKLFFTQDERLMSPAEVMALRPRPDVITYQ